MFPIIYYPPTPLRLHPSAAQIEAETSQTPRESGPFVYEEPIPKATTCFKKFLKIKQEERDVRAKEKVQEAENLFERYQESRFKIKEETPSVEVLSHCRDLLVWAKQSCDEAFALSPNIFPKELSKSIEIALKQTEKEIDQFTVDQLLSYSLKNPDDLETLVWITANWLSSYSENHLFLSPYLEPIKKISNHLLDIQNHLSKLDFFVISLVKSKIGDIDPWGSLSEKAEESISKDCKKLFSDLSIRQMVIELTPSGFAEFTKKIDDHLSLEAEISCRYIVCCSNNLYKLSSDQNIDARHVCRWLREILEKDSLPDVQQIFS